MLIYENATSGFIRVYLDIDDAAQDMSFGASAFEGKTLLSDIQSGCAYNIYEWSLDYLITKILKTHTAEHTKDFRASDAAMKVINRELLTRALQDSKED